MSNYIVAIYERGQEFGGAEEGGWYYETGELRRVSKVFDNAELAVQYAERMNMRFDRKARGPGRQYWSAAYGGGHYVAQVFLNKAPGHYPRFRPVYS